MCSRVTDGFNQLKLQSGRRGNELKVGCNGLGIMGKQLSKNLLKDGDELVIFCRSKEYNGKLVR